jgi:hypothetical protein
VSESNSCLTCALKRLLSEAGCLGTLDRVRGARPYHHWSPHGTCGNHKLEIHHTCNANICLMGMTRRAHVIEMENGEERLFLLLSYGI